MSAPPCFQEEWERLGRLAWISLRQLDRHRVASDESAECRTPLTVDAHSSTRDNRADEVDRRLARIEASIASLRHVLENKYEAEVVEPLIQRVLPAVDLLAEVLGDGDQHHAAAFGAQCELLELLAGYGVEPLRARPGSAFDPRWMRPERAIATLKQREHKTVAAMTRMGFGREHRVLRPALVVILKYKETSSHDRSD